MADVGYAAWVPFTCETLCWTWAHLTCPRLFCYLQKYSKKLYLGGNCTKHQSSMSSLLMAAATVWQYENYHWCSEVSVCKSWKQTEKHSFSSLFSHGALDQKLMYLPMMQLLTSHPVLLHGAEVMKSHAHSLIVNTLICCDGDLLKEKWGFRIQSSYFIPYLTFNWA